MNNKQIYRLAAVVTALAVVGCSGGGSGSGFTSTPSDARRRREAPLGSSVRLERYHRVRVRDKNSSPYGIRVGPGMAHFWFAEHKAGKLGRVATSGTITEPANLTGQAPHFPFYVATGSDANLWTTADNIASSTAIESKKDNAPPLGSVMRVTPTGEVTTYLLPAQYSDPRGIAEGPDGNVWFAETRGAIGKITPAGILTEYAVPDGGRPFVINVGPDGALWFTESENNQIGRITTSGVITTYPFPDGSGPTGVVSGPDGNLWITEYFANKVAQVATSGTILHEYCLREPVQETSSSVATGTCISPSSEPDKSGDSPS